MGSGGQSFGDELENQINDALSKLASKNPFQSDWDIAAFAIFFIFIGKCGAKLAVLNMLVDTWDSHIQLLHSRTAVQGHRPWEAEANS